MNSYGFISDNLGIKFLILYIGARVMGPVSFAALQELSMCDSGVDYFSFSECLADLLRTGHMEQDEEKQYSITEKGRRNSAICESSLPYTVRMRAEQKLAAYNEQVKRTALVGAQVVEREKGGYEVTLSLSDELDDLMRLTLLVTRQDMALELQNRYRAHAEEIYSKLLAVLYGG